MKAILRITKGITTKKIKIPESCLYCFKVPISQCSSLRTILETSKLDYCAEKDGIPVLEFCWDGISYWGDKNVKDPIFILDLKRVYNY